jgi:hypothetical protein
MLTLRHYPRPWGRSALAAVLISASFFLVALGPTASPVAASSSSLTVLATGQSYPGVLVAKGGHVYWSDFGSETIMKVPETGGVVKTIVNDYSPNGVGALQVYQGNVYWTNTTEVFKVSTSGGPLTPLAVSSAPPGISGMVVSGGLVYFINSGYVDTVSVNGGPVSKLVSLASMTIPLTLATGGGYLAAYDLYNGSVVAISLKTLSLHLVYGGMANCPNIIEGGIQNMFISKGSVYFTENDQCSNQEIGMVGNASLSSAYTGGPMYEVTGPTGTGSPLINGIALYPESPRTNDQMVFGTTTSTGNGVYMWPIYGPTNPPPSFLFSLEAEGVSVGTGNVIYATGSSEVVSYT